MSNRSSVATLIDLTIIFVLVAAVLVGTIASLTSSREPSSAVGLEEAPQRQFLLAKLPKPGDLLVKDLPLGGGYVLLVVRGHSEGVAGVIGSDEVESHLKEGWKAVTSNDSEFQSLATQFVLQQKVEVSGPMGEEGAPN